MIPQADRLSAARRPLGVARLCALALLLASPVALAQGRRHHRRPRPAAAAPTPAPGIDPAEASSVDQPKDPGGKASNSGGKPGATGKKGGKEQTFDFEGFSLDAGMMTPQLLYFLDRAEEELDRASLKRRSFVPEMVLSLDQESL